MAFFLQMIQKRFAEFLKTNYVKAFIFSISILVLDLIQNKTLNLFIYANYTNIQLKVNHWQNKML